MKLVLDEDPKPKQVRINGITNGHNGHNEHVNEHVNGHVNGRTIEEESESEEEEEEPVSASLVLRVVTEAPSPSLSRKPSFRRDGAPAFLTEDPNHGTYLQVQVQRSSSSSSLGSRKISSRSRHSSSQAREDEWAVARQPNYSRLSSRESSASPSPSLYDLSEMDLTGPNGVNTVDFMQRVSSQTRLIQQGIKSLRSEVDNPTHLLEVGQEAIVLSGLNKHASDSLKNIKNLYDETKFLKTYLEKLEAKVHYDIAMRRKTPYTPPWWRRLLFLGVVFSAGGFLWHRQSPDSLSLCLASASFYSSLAAEASLQFFTSGSGGPRTSVVIL